ncbi:LysR family transcriptional regulator [Amycolatopsis alkalitolerans]|uniref:LysR family transcriptional regulator n=1 Tax=Amycolatopsis alkalitolerans TaxID=2547244 RepID=A0A5C4LR58_9PSEU|nr:LysR family transcriptional regulator [Amycolatopsis alkalitolerans]TNC18853.1 LysR family transcriptional regulator [Amycolatopsis alkalitolerans]
MKRAVAHLANLDLNLLVMLRELIRERNVTRAAERVGVTQPAASAALSRLRRHFGDELLVRGKGGYVLSPLATQLAEQVEVVCAAAERLFAAGESFDPRVSRREFTLLVADYTIAVLGEHLARLLDEKAPHVRLHLRLVREAMVADVEENIRLMDGMIAPPVGRFRIPGLQSTELFRDRWVCIVAAENRELDTDTPTLDDLARLSWVAPYQANQGYPTAAPLSQQLTAFGIRPNVAVRVESYQAVPHLVAGTDRIALLQERLACQVAGRLGLRVLECPGNPEPIVERFWWHGNFDDDPGHVWLRGALAEAARRADASRSS